MAARIDEVAPKQQCKCFADAGTRNLSDNGRWEFPEGAKAFRHGCIEVFRSFKTFFKIGAGREDVSAASEKHYAHFGVDSSCFQGCSERAKHVARNRIAPCRSIDRETKNAVFGGRKNAHKG